MCCPPTTSEMTPTDRSGRLCTAAFCRSISDLPGSETKWVNEFQINQRLSTSPYLGNNAIASTQPLSRGKIDLESVITLRPLRPHDVERHRLSGLVLSSDKLPEPPEQFWKLPQKRLRHLHQFTLRHYLLIVQGETPKEVVVDILRANSLTNLEKIAESM